MSLKFLPWANWRVLGLLGLTAYAVTVMATLPASLVVPDAFAKRIAVSGTIWSGSAMSPQGFAARWELSPLRSILNLALAADWTLQGAETDIRGEIVAGRNTIELIDINGRAGWPLAKAVSPGLSGQCDLAVRVEFADLLLGAGTQTLAGSLHSGDASCVFIEGGVTRTVKIPPLIATSDTGGRTMRLIEVGTGTAWGEVSLLEDRRLAVTSYAPMIAAASGQPGSEPISLEFGF